MVYTVVWVFMLVSGWERNGKLGRYGINCYIIFVFQDVGVSATNQQSGGRLPGPAESIASRCYICHSNVQTSHIFLPLNKNLNMKHIYQYNPLINKGQPSGLLVLFSAGPGKSKPDAEGRVRRPADRFLFSGGEAEEDNRGQPRAGFTLDGWEGAGGQQAERWERERQQVLMFIFL